MNKKSNKEEDMILVTLVMIVRLKGKVKGKKVRRPEGKLNTLDLCYTFYAKLKNNFDSEYRASKEMIGGGYRKVDLYRD